MQHFSLVAHYGGQTLGLIQLPLMHSNTSLNACVKHRRALEESLLAKRIDFGASLTLHFSKPTDSSGNDRRKCGQQVLVCSSDPEKLQWTVPAVIGPHPLVKISDMIGWDSENKPSPGARVEQIPVLWSNDSFMPNRHNNSTLLLSFKHFEIVFVLCTYLTGLWFPYYPSWPGRGWSCTRRSSRIYSTVWIGKMARNALSLIWFPTGQGRKQRICIANIFVCYK